MKVVALAAVAALGWGSAASAANALWLQHPMNGDIEREYPRKARAKREAGVVELTCKLNVESRLEACAVKSETPPEFGFGEAALKLVSRFKMRKVVNGKEVAAGTEVTVPIKFDPS